MLKFFDLSLFFSYINGLPQRKTEGRFFISLFAFPLLGAN
ncbi:hypothetical protein PORCAN_695 [Porphyromonas crevioricanis JCM 13913]|nr:hypothetical protein PORCAN_695 [Porphyromonas crevioricanis JCM 13913]